MEAQLAGSQPATLDRWLAPISDSKPAGENVRYEPEHEALRTAVGEMEGLQGASIDWAAFSSQAEDLLARRSKDLLIAAYLAYALLQTEGARGLANGLALICGMIDRYWESCFPDVGRTRARVNALSWLVERATIHLNETSAGQGDGPALASLTQETQRFQQVVTARFGAGAIDMAPFIAAVNKLNPSAAISAAASTEPQSQTPAAAAPPAAPEGAPASTSTTGADPVEAKLAELAQPFAKPIAGTNRAGQNARYDPTYEAIRQELGKLNRAAGEDVDWALVRDSGRGLLEEQSKDFVIACYFAVASYALDGLPGLIQGIVAISTLLRDFWDDGFPPPERVRARVNAIDWFIERVDSVGHLAMKEVQDQDFRLLSRAATELQELVLDRFQDEAPSIYGLKGTLERIELSIIRQKKPEPKPTAEPPKPESEPSREAATPSSELKPTPPPPRPQRSVELSVPDAPLTNPLEVRKFLGTVGGTLNKASQELFKASQKDPLAYRLSRRGLYLAILSTPEVTQGNRTSVPVPPRFQGTAEQFDKLLAAKEYEKLLGQTEPSLLNLRFWFDVHRYVAAALAGLGYEEARQAVFEETMAVVQRLPGVLEREFNDGTPFASAETQEWLSTTAPASSSASAADAAVADGLDEQLIEAQQLARGGKVEEAVVALSAIVNGKEMSARDRFRVKLAMARACSAGGSHHLADGILAGLTAEIAEFRLEEWEPKMAEACYRARYEALSAMGPQSAESLRTLHEVYRQLCRVTPLGALKLGPPPRGR